MRSSTKALVVILAVFGILVSADSAAAAYLPGGSGLDQYVETLPSVEGNSTDSSDGNGSSPGGTRPGIRESLPSGVRQALVDSGEAGVATASLAELTAPPRRAVDTAWKLGSARDSGDGESSLAAVLNAGKGSSDDSGLGILLPLLLAASLIGAVAIGASRFSQRGGFHPG